MQTYFTWVNQSRSSCQAPIPLLRRGPESPAVGSELELAFADVMRQLDAHPGQRHSPVGA